MSDFCTRCGAQFREDDAFCAKCGTPRSPGDQPAYGAPAPQPAAARTGPPARKGIKILPLLLGLLLPLGMGLFFIFGGIGDCGSTEGSVTVNGPEKDFTFTPTGCASLQPYGRMGANLHGEGPNDGAVYVSVDPLSGTRVEIEIPGSCANANGTDCTVFSVPRDHCTVYEASVEPTSTTVNDVRLVEGQLRIECVLDDGTQVQGAITFSGC